MTTRHGTVTAGSTVTVDLGSDFNSLEVLNRSTATLWVQMDPTDQTALTPGADNLEVVTGTSAATFPSRSQRNTSVKLMADGGNINYSLRGE